MLLTVDVALGLLRSLRWRSHTGPRCLIEDVHQYLQWITGIVLALGVVSTLLDSFVHFLLYQVLVPFTGPCRLVWIGLGIIAMVLGIALALSIYVRRSIGYHACRLFHYAGFAAWVFALAHALATGTDTRTVWAMTVYGVGVALIAGIMAVRFGGLPLPLGQGPEFRPTAVWTCSHGR